MDDIGDELLLFIGGPICEANLDGEHRSETVCQEGNGSPSGLLIVTTQPSILSCPFEGKESEKPAPRESDNMREKIAARYIWKRIDAEAARILFGASGPACFQVELRYETHR